MRESGERTWEKAQTLCAVYSATGQDTEWDGLAAWGFILLGGTGWRIFHQNNCAAAPTTLGGNPEVPSEDRLLCFLQ